MSYVAAPEAFAPAVAQAPSMYLPTTQSMVAYPQAYGAYPGFQFTAAPATTTPAAAPAATPAAKPATSPAKTTTTKATTPTKKTRAAAAKTGRKKKACGSC